MRHSLIELIQISEQKEYSELNNLEKIIVDYLTPEISIQALNDIKSLSEEEFLWGLNNYLSQKTFPLWSNALNFSNAHLFLLADNSFAKEIIYDFLQDSQFQAVKAFYNPYSKKCKIQNPEIGKIFKNLNPTIEESEISAAVDQLENLEESLDIELPVCLVKQSSGLIWEMKLGVEEVKEEKSFWGQSLIKPVQAAVLVATLFSASVSFGDDNTQKAISHATKAALAQPEIKKTVDQVEKTVVKEAEELVKQTGTEIPVTVIGYGIKLATERKVKLKGKAPEFLQVPVNYEVSVGLNNEYNMQISGQNTLLKDSGKYYIQGGAAGSDKKIQMGIEFDF